MTRKIFALTTTALLASAFALTTPAAPANVDTSAEKAAWEALMSPVGEYAAYATYDAILKKYGQVEPYATILRSEQMHINALTRQLARYGVAVPANPYIGKITLPADLTSIAKAEAQTEVDNAALYDKLMSQAGGDAMLARVFTNLQSASRNVHLPLFTQAAAAGGKLSADAMTAFHTQNMNAQGQRGQGQNGQRGNMQGQGMRQNGQAQGFAQQGQRGRANGLGMNSQNQTAQNQTNQYGQRGYGQQRGRGQGHMNSADCPMQGGTPMNGQGQGYGPGWRK